MIELWGYKLYYSYYNTNQGYCMVGLLLDLDIRSLIPVINSK